MALAGAVGAGILGVGFTAQISKYVKRMDNDRKMQSSAPKIERGQQDQVYQILSCLVAGVYAADRGEENAVDYWTKLGYEELELGEQHSPTAELADVGKRSEVRWMLFRRRSGDGANCKELSQPLANGLKSQTQKPKYVVAIRGTIIENCHDHIANLHNFCEMLHTHEQYFKPVESLILDLVKKSSIEDVWVAGHSLGAAIALIATRRLALEGKLLETHLFNLPDVNVGVVAKKAVKSLAKGVFDFMGKVIPGTDSERIREVVAPVAQQAGDWLNSCAEETGRLLAPTYSEDMAEECDKLLQAKWTPHLYVNPKDPICSDYLKHFKSNYYDQDTASSRPPSSTWSSTLVQGSRSNHLIPAAILYINNWGEGFPEPHALHQWYNYDVVNLEVRSYIYPKAETDSDSDSEGEIASASKLVTTKFSFGGILVQ